MPFITQGKTNWKFLLIVIILAVIVGGWILLGLILPIPPSWQPVSLTEQCKENSDCIETCCGCIGKKETCDILCEFLPGKECMCVNRKCDVKKDETADWKTYKSEELGVEFEYPGEWGKLTPKSQKDETYIFDSDNKLITEIKFYKPTKTLAFITKGTIYREAKKQSGQYPLSDEAEVCDYILKIIYPTGEIKTVFTQENKPSVKDGKTIYPYWGGIEIGGIKFWPNEKYISLSWAGYEITGSYLLDIDSGQDILKSYPIWNGDIYWSPDSKTLAIRSSHNDFSGEGETGIFVSDYQEPEKLNKVFVLAIPECGSSYFENIKFSGDDKVLFSVVLNAVGLECGGGQKIREYEYNVKTKELREIK